MLRSCLIWGYNFIVATISNYCSWISVFLLSLAPWLWYPVCWGYPWALCWVPAWGRGSPGRTHWSADSASLLRVRLHLPRWGRPQPQLVDRRGHLAGNDSCPNFVEENVKVLEKFSLNKTGIRMVSWQRQAKLSYV